MSQNRRYTVDVGVPSTTFKEHRVNEPSFADVCVGDQARALGSVSTDDVVTATEVIVVPPSPQKVSGTGDLGQRRQPLPARAGRRGRPGTSA